MNKQHPMRRPENRAKTLNDVIKEIARTEGVRASMEAMDLEELNTLASHVSRAKAE